MCILALIALRDCVHLEGITGCRKVNEDYESYSSVELSCNGVNSHDYTYVNGYSFCFAAVFLNAPIAQVKHLSTGDCRGSRLNNTLADFLPNVIEYDISFHEVETINSDDLGFGSLAIFNASHNKLTDLSGAIFSQTPQLNTIDFSYNKIKRLKAESFSDLDRLNILDLSYNSIEDIENNMFEHNNELKTLYLIGNPMKHFDCNIFNQYMRSFTVYVSWEHLKELNANCMKGRETLTIEMTESMITFDIIKSILEEYEEVTFSKKMEITDNVRALNYFNISGNEIENIEVVSQLKSPIEILDVSHNTFHDFMLTSSSFEDLNNLKFLNLSHTQVSFIQVYTFDNMLDLITLDLSNNLLKTIDENLFEKNIKLKDVFLGNNQFKQIDCSIFALMKNAINMHISLESVEEINTICLGNSLEINFNEKDQIIFHGNGTRFNCSRHHFQQLKSLKIAGNHLENTHQVIEAVGSSIETLDLSRNFIGPLEPSTFEKFDHLLYLNLSSTNLSNFGFNTFYHQTNLLSLDLSYNHLGEVDFTLLLRNFRTLLLLNLEGNDLTEIITVKPLNFPQLASLGISKNNFSCQYLANFLQQWPHLHLFHNPSKQTHIGGTDCIHDQFAEAVDHSSSGLNAAKANFDMKSTIKDRTNIEMNAEKSKAAHESNSSSFILDELRALKYLFLVVIVICCGYFVVKSQMLHRIRQRWIRDRMDNMVAYQQNHESNQGQIQLLGES